MTPAIGRPAGGSLPRGRIEPDALPGASASQGVEAGRRDTPAAKRLLAVIDDTRTAGALLDISCALAELMRRELRLVYVESAAALAAAALPTSLVLAQATARWTPLAAPDLERAWQADAGRLRALAAQASLARAVAWSLQVTRGTLRETALALQAQSDLLLVGGSASSLAELSGTAPRSTTHPTRHGARPSSARQLVLALDDGSDAAQQAVAIARQLSDALGARLEVQRFDPAQGGPPRLVRPDLVVMPGPWTVPRGMAAPQRRTPTLLVRPLAPPAR